MPSNRYAFDFVSIIYWKIRSGSNNLGSTYHNFLPFKVSSSGSRLLSCFDPLVTSTSILSPYSMYFRAFVPFSSSFGLSHMKKYSSTSSGFMTRPRTFLGEETHGTRNSGSIPHSSAFSLGSMKKSLHPVVGPLTTSATSPSGLIFGCFISFLNTGGALR